MQIALDVVRHIMHLLLDIPGGLLHGLLHFVQLVQTGNIANLGLEVIDIALRATDERAQGTRNGREFFGADDDQGHNAYQGQFGNSQVNHA